MLTFRTLALAALLPVTLAGCATVSNLLPALEPETVARLSGGDVRVPAPNGFCVDDTGSNLRAGFAIMAPCATISEDGASPRNSALITAQVGEVGSASVKDNETVLAAFLETDAGAALLAQDAAEVAVKSTATASNDVRVAFEVASEVAGTTGTVRRAFLDVGDRLVTLTVRSLSVAPLSNTVARFMLADLVSATQRANQPAQETVE